jgi:hypothetical protein
MKKAKGDKMVKTPLFWRFFLLKSGENRMKGEEFSLFVPATFLLINFSI